MRIKTDLFVYEAPRKKDFHGRLLDLRSVKDVLDLPTQGVADVYSDAKWVRNYYEMRGHRVFPIPAKKPNAAEIKLEDKPRSRRGRESKSVQLPSDVGATGVDNTRHQDSSEDAG